MTRPSRFVASTAWPSASRISDRKRISSSRDSTGGGSGMSARRHAAAKVTRAGTDEAALDRAPSRMLFSAHVDAPPLLRLLLLRDPILGPLLEACARLTSQI